MSKIFVNVEGTILKDGKWLMIVRGEKEEHAAGTLSMVGGTLETEINLDNALEMTLHREIQEEIGIEVEDEMVYIESKTFTTDSGNKCLDVVFLCKYKSGEPKTLTDEVSDILWMTTEEVMNYSKTPLWIKQSIKLAAECLQNT